MMLLVPLVLQFLQTLCVCWRYNATAALTAMLLLQVPLQSLLQQKLPQMLYCD